MPPIYGHTFVSSMMEISYWSGRKFSKAQMMKQLGALEKPTKDCFPNSRVVNQNRQKLSPPRVKRGDIAKILATTQSKFLP